MSVEFCPRIRGQIHLVDSHFGILRGTGCVRGSDVVHRAKPCGAPSTSHYPAFLPAWPGGDWIRSYRSMIHHLCTYSSSGSAPVWNVYFYWTLSSVFEGARPVENLFFLRRGAPHAFGWSLWLCCLLPTTAMRFWVIDFFKNMLIQGLLKIVAPGLQYHDTLVSCYINAPKWHA